MPKVRDESCGLHPNSNVAFLSRLHRAVRTSPNSGLRVNGARHSLTGGSRRRSRRWIGLGILVRSRRKRNFSCFCWDLRVSEQRSLGSQSGCGAFASEFGVPRSFRFRTLHPKLHAPYYTLSLAPCLPLSLAPCLPLSVSLFRTLCGRFDVGFTKPLYTPIGSMESLGFSFPSSSLTIQTRRVPFCPLFGFIRRP